MIRKYLKRGTVNLAVAAAALMLVLSGCEKKKEVVEDYFETADSAEKGAEKESEGGAPDTNAASSSEDGKLSDKLGGTELEYMSDFSIGDKPVKLYADYEINDTDELPTYAITPITENDVHEEEMVKAVFGDTGEALNKEDRKYLNTDLDDSAYLISACQAISRHNGGEYNQISQKSKSWIDEDDYYIHTYEGKRNGIVYQFMVSYSKKYNEKVIALYPKNAGDISGDNKLNVIGISDPDGLMYAYDYKAKEVKTFNVNTDMGDSPNKSTSTEDELRDSIVNTMHDDFFIDFPKEEITFAVSYYQTYDFGNGTDEPQKSELIYYGEDNITDTDMSDAVRDGYSAEFKHTLGGQDILASISSTDMHSDEILTSQFLVNDSGLVGFSVVSRYNFGTKLSDNVSVLKFEDAMKAFEKAMSENVDLTKASITTDKIEFKNIQLMYCPVEDSNGGYCMIPAWVGDIDNAGYINVRGIISAIDGSFIKVIYPE